MMALEADRLSFSYGGQVSIAMGGQLVRGVTPDYLATRLNQIQYRNSEPKKFAKWKGWRSKNERA